MSKRATRDQIVETADQLFYHQGFDHTSFSHIADAVQISRGNFYHHFKSKDEILDAVICLRQDNTRKMLEEWEDQTENPAERIRCYIRVLFTNWDKIKYFGCPVGTLCTELAKLNHASQEEANKIFTLFRTWLARQFTLLGFTEEADALAMHVIAWSQGVATLANTFHDEKFVWREVRQISDWLSELIEGKGGDLHYGSVPGPSQE